MPLAPTAIDSYRSLASWQAAGVSDGSTPITAYRPPAPPGLFGFASQAAARLADVVGRAEAARADALQARSAAFERRTAASSAPAALTAAATDRARTAAYDIAIERVAAAQRNEGRPLDSTGAGGIAAGSHRFAITVGSRTTEAEVDIAASDTNATALAKLRDAIRASGAGVHAIVVRDASAGTSRLRLTAAGTGSDFAFELMDVSGSAAADSGIDAVASAAVNARYRVNGGAPRDSSSNTMLLDNGNVLATMREAGDEPVRLTVGPDTGAIVKNVKKLAESYNALRSSVEAAGGVLEPGAALAASRLPADGLDDIGIARQADGSLAVDEERLAEALVRRPDEAKRRIAGPGGLAAAVERAAAPLVSAPTAALLHPSALARQASFPLYTAHRGIYPAWVGMVGLQLNAEF
ncbi:hypothetical protein [Paenibacillus sp.]|uniref:hypothetical protein n=1 Tax=Paenibacillus sp. TaxID=58172 RepID=UPI002D4C5A0A|nr:hypothetical protein [Paenibacillus sp.]HZG55710.1 hypothetical protein [Paenibacillus sp.]